MFKMILNFGNVTLVIDSKEKWNSLVDRYRTKTVDETLGDIYITLNSDYEETRTEAEQLKEETLRSLARLQERTNRKLNKLYNVEIDRNLHEVAS